MYIFLENDPLVVPHSLEACSVVLYLYKDVSLHSFVVLMSIEDQHYLCTGCNDVNAGIGEVSVPPGCL